MPRDFWLQGETMVSVKGNNRTIISSLTQLGLSNEEPIRGSLHHEFEDIMVDAWGGGRVPVDTQNFLGWCDLTINFVHVDRVVLEACLSESLYQGNPVGTMGRTGARMGGGAARFVFPNHYIGLNLSNTVGDLFVGPARPLRFWYAYLAQQPLEFDLGTHRTIWRTQWKALAYTNDPWGGAQAGVTPAQPGTAPGTGSQGAVLFDFTLDT